MSETNGLQFHAVPTTRCPGCGGEGDEALGLATHQPQPGDYAFCPACGFLSIYGEGLTRRELTLEEEAALPVGLMLILGELNRNRETLQETLQELLG